MNYGTVNEFVEVFYALWACKGSQMHGILTLGIAVHSIVIHLWLIYHLWDSNWIIVLCTMHGFSLRRFLELLAIILLLSYSYMEISSMPYFVGEFYILVMNLMLNSWLHNLKRVCKNGHTRLKSTCIQYATCLIASMICMGDPYQNPLLKFIQEYNHLSWTIILGQPCLFMGQAPLSYEGFHITPSLM